jgi:SnoaL-like polyketide cyclase
MLSRLDKTISIIGPVTMPTRLSRPSLKGETYSNRNQDHPFTGEAIDNFAKTVWTVFPDFSLDLISIGDTGGGLVALQWVYHGTNTGAFPDGTPATGPRVTYPAASFVRVQGIKFVRNESILTG